MFMILKVESPRNSVRAARTNSKRSSITTSTRVSGKFVIRYDLQGIFCLQDLIISRVMNHVTCYRFESSHWLKLQDSDWREYFNQ